MGDATIDEVVEMLKVEWESPPVPTISHWTPRPVITKLTSVQQDSNGMEINLPVRHYSFLPGPLEP